MKPVNSRSLLAFVFDQMDKLDSGDIDVEKAKAQASLCHQANGLLNYELKRVKTLIELNKHNFEFKRNTSLRDIESKGFAEIGNDEQP
jgi:hypothetical protein